MKIAAIVPHWNRSDLLQVLLPNIAQQTRPFDQVLVVDNGSTDDSRQVAKTAGADVLTLDRNYGFAAAVNRGVKATDADWVAILNNDVTLAPDWLNLLEAHIGKHSFLTSKILSAADPSKIDATYDELSRGACAYRCGAGKPDGAVWNQPSQIRFAPMTAALFRRKLFESIGPLDEDFGSYLEDVDFGLRCALAGEAGLYVPAAVAWHRGSATSGAWHKNTVRLLARNQMLLMKKHFRGQPRWPLLAGQLLWGLVALRHGRGLAWLQGKWEGCSLRPVPVRANPERFGNILENSERHIRELQQLAGYDSYWRAYFWLLGR